MRPDSIRFNSLILSRVCGSVVELLKQLPNMLQVGSLLPAVRTCGLGGLENKEHQTHTCILGYFQTWVPIV
eukprot:3278810-Amphidinium_carterae.1